jgi:hypothetical protein
VVEISTAGGVLRGTATASRAVTILRNTGTVTGVLVGDDVTGIGVADDVAIPFVIVGCNSRWGNICRRCSYLGF